MKKFLTSLALLALLSCKDDAVKHAGGTEIETATDTTINSIRSGNQGKKLISEDELAKAQNAIENAPQQHRKELMYKYLSYSDKVDGITAEGFPYFAYHYEEEHSKDFYSVLAEKDTAFVRQWAQVAASEACLGMETFAEAEAFVQEIEYNKEKNAKSLNDTEKKLYLLYIDKLQKQIIKNFSGMTE